MKRLQGLFISVNTAENVVYFNVSLRFQRYIIFVTTIKNKPLFGKVCLFVTNAVKYCKIVRTKKLA